MSSSLPSASALPLKDLIKPHIHHEKQEPGSMLCAQHALNNLLQGNYFDAAQLADIAAQLDALERDNLEMSDADWNNREAAGRNADETGFFSVTVLETALQVWGISLVRWASSEMQPYRNAPEEQLAFILNLQNHWFCFRSFGPNGILWYNLNSFLPEPSWVGSKFLGALLDQSQTEGYSVFVIRPSTQDAQQRSNVEAQFRGSAADHMVAQEQPGLGDVDEDAALEEAIRASLAGRGGSSSSSSSLPRSTPRQGSSAGKRRRSKRQGDEDLQAALAASMKTAGPSRMGGTADTAISLEDDDEDGGGGAHFDGSTSAQPSRSPFLNPALRDQITEGIDDDGDLDEMEDLDLPDAGAGAGAAGLSTTAAARTHARHAHAGDLAQPIEIDSDEDLDGDDDAHDWRASAAAFHNMRDRDYDDEDAELQRALALSMAEGGRSGGGGGRQGAAASTSTDTADLEDADPEEQARILAQILKTRERRSPTPADVGRIAKMREEAKRKEEEERQRRERRERGEFTPEPENAKKARTGGDADGADDDDDDDDEDEGEEEQKPLSPEELRKMRLARFGGS